MNRKRITVVAAWWLVTACSSAFAQQVEGLGKAVLALERPDPTTVAVPDLAFKPSASAVEDFDLYFYFHKSGVTYERAFADLDICRQYMLETEPVTHPKPFVPLGGNAIPTRPEFIPIFGLVGTLLEAHDLHEAEEDNQRSTSRRCMAYKGYARYGLTETLWQKLQEGGGAEKLARQALIAASPAPQTKALDP